MMDGDYRVGPPAAPGTEVPPDAGEDLDAALLDDAPELRRAQLGAAQHGLRLDRALVALAPEFSRTHLQGLIAAGHVRLDGVAAPVAARPGRAGQWLTVELVATEESRAFRPEAIELSIAYEDAHLLVVDKPAGLVVHPAPGHWSGTLLNALLARHAAAAVLPRAGIVHRLDKDTSGLMVVARTLPAMTALTRAIAARSVQREYLALAHGAWPAGVTTVDAALGRDPRSRVRVSVLASGRPARTDFERLAFAAAPEGGASALRCTLHTGRTHQIRVHAASRGHPLVGDALYGGRPALGMARQALHAARLAFEHPVEGGLRTFASPLPADMASAWAAVAGRQR
jgi:23S rRNA pseudouridine1911/1915/1917 synthase